MLLCPFCAYLNGFSLFKPKKESYYNDAFSSEPFGFRNIDESGALLDDNFKLYPRSASDMFDKIELQIVNQDVKDSLSMTSFKIVCDVCLFNMYGNNDCIVLKELNENEKLFRLYMRKV